MSTDERMKLADRLAKATRASLTVPSTDKMSWPLHDILDQDELAFIAAALRAPEAADAGAVPSRERLEEALVEVGNCCKALGKTPLEPITDFIRRLASPTAAGTAAPPADGHEYTGEFTAVEFIKRADEHEKAARNGMAAGPNTSYTRTFQACAAALRYAAQHMFVAAPPAANADAVRVLIHHHISGHMHPETANQIAGRLAAVLSAPVAGADAGMRERADCEACDGTGDFQGGRRTLQKPPCQRCNGTGQQIAAVPHR